VSGLFPISMKVVNESRGVVGTSFCSINGKHGRIGCGDRLSTQSSLVNNFSCKSHTDLILHLTEGCKCSVTEENVDAKP
jgi:hypothetical protein